LTSNQQSESKKPLINSKRLILTLTILIVVALAAVILSYGSLTANTTHNNQLSDNEDLTQPTTTPQPASPTSWITKGAYATYEGQAEILSMSIQFNARMEVVDLNSTHVNIQTSFDMTSPAGSTENTTSVWVSREEMNFQPEGLNLTSSYTTQLTLPNLGTRNCIVYQYSDQDFSATYYIDSTLQWPLKMAMTSPTSDDGQSYNMDVNLVDSNIPGL
jgi:cytoskeletal protein RodZ